MNIISTLPVSRLSNHMYGVTNPLIFGPVLVLRMMLGFAVILKRCLLNTITIYHMQRDYFRNASQFISMEHVLPSGVFMYLSFIDSQ